MDNESYKFDIQVQKKFLALLFQDFSFLSTNGTEIIKPEYFDTIYLRNVARWIIDYFTQYQTKPTTEVLITELDNYSAKTKVSEIDREQYLDLINYLSTEVVNEGEYLKEQLLEFARSVAFGNALEESFNIYDSDGDYTKAISIMEKALTVGVGSNLGLSLVDCVSDLPDRLKSRYDRHNMFRTGIKSLDKALGGGCAKGEVHVICFTGDTKVKTDKGDIRLDELINSFSDKKVYVVNDENKVTESKIRQVFVSGKTDKLIKLFFEDGSCIKCTLDHKFAVLNTSINDPRVIVKNGIKYIKACDLTENDEILSENEVSYD